METPWVSTPPQVGGHKDLRAQRGVLGGHAHLLEDGRHGPAEIVGRDAHLVFSRHLETFEHHNPQDFEIRAGTGQIVPLLVGVASGGPVAGVATGPST